MTFREKLQQEHPESITEEGWCTGCPETYGYERTTGCPKDQDGYSVSCWECWSRKMPEEVKKGNEEVEKAPKKNKFVTFTMPHTCKKVGINPANIETVMEREDGTAIYCFNDNGFWVRESYEDVMRILEEGE